MKSETAFKAVDFLIEHSGDVNDLELYFFGGEPLLNFSVLKDTVEYAHKKEAETGKKFRFSVTTNGTFLTEEMPNISTVK